jgi:hypothetical protein
MTKAWAGKLAAFLVIASCLLWFTSSVDAHKDDLPRMPGVALLVGHFPEDLAVTVGDKTTQIEAGGGWEVLPSLSADGRMVASARMVSSRFADAKLTFLVGTYNLVDEKWTEYKDLAIKGGSVAISPDGSKLACSKMVEGDPLLHILDLKTGKIWIGPETTRDAVFLTWAPDGRRIAFSKEFHPDPDGTPSSLLPQIYVLNLEDGKVSRIAEGTAPSWSPSGEWIAFSDYSVFQHGKYADTAFRLSMVHPDGTGTEALLQRGKDLMLPPIWSPDSKGLLIQQPEEDEANPRVNVYMLDLAKLNLTAKFKKTPEIYGWANAR